MKPADYLASAHKAERDGDSDAAREFYTKVIQMSEGTREALTAKEDLQALEERLAPRSPCSQPVNVVKNDRPATHSTNNVTLVGMSIPFWDLVILLIKLSLAAIPAGIILILMSMLVIFIAAPIFSGLLN